MSNALLILGGNLVAILVWAVCGWALVAPFARALPGVVLAAPLAGLLAHVGLTLLLYVHGGLSFVTASLVAPLPLLCASVLLRPLPRLRPGQMLLLLVVPVVAALLASAWSLTMGEPTLLFERGTDQAGYAQLADWMLSHPASQRPRLSPDLPGESWPAAMFETDPRFGTYGLLAVLAGVRGLRGLLAYDLALGAALAAGSLAMGGLFCRSLPAMAAIATVMLAGSWLDLGQSGFLGKALGYPAAFLVAGLLLGAARLEREGWLAATVAMVALGLAAGLAYPGQVLAVLAPTLAVPGLLADRLLRARDATTPPGATRFALGLAVLAGLVMSVASGTLARVLSASYPGFGAGPVEALDVAAGLDWLGRLGLQSTLLGTSLTLVAGIVVLLGIGVAVATRNGAALGLLGGPVLLVLALAGSGRLAAAAQLTGFVGPAVLAGAIALVAPRAGAWGRWSVAAAVLIVLPLLPRIGMTLRDTVPSEDRAGFAITSGAMQALNDAMAGHRVLIDVSAPVQHTLAISELADGRAEFAYSPAAWQTFVGYRDWPAPPTGAYDLVLRPATAEGKADVLLQAGQFELVRAVALPP